MIKLPKDKRNRILLVGVGTLIVGGGLYAGLIQGQLDAVRLKSVAVKAATEKGVQAAQMIKKSAQYKQELMESTVALDAIEASMASGGIPWIYKIVPNFIETRHRNVILSDVSSGPRYGEVGYVERFPYQAVTYSIELTARYRDFGAFLADFENQFPYMRVQNLEVGPPRKAGQGDEDKLSFRLDIMALVKPGVSP